MGSDWISPIKVLIPIAFVIFSWVRDHILLEDGFLRLLGDVVSGSYLLEDIDFENFLLGDLLRLDVLRAVRQGFPKKGHRTVLILD